MQIFEYIYRGIQRYSETSLEKLSGGLEKELTGVKWIIVYTYIEENKRNSEWEICGGGGRQICIDVGCMAFSEPHFAPQVQSGHQHCFTVSSLFIWIQLALWREISDGPTWMALPLRTNGAFKNFFFYRHTNDTPSLAPLNTCVLKEHEVRGAEVVLLVLNPEKNSLMFVH